MLSSNRNSTHNRITDIGSEGDLPFLTFTKKRSKSISHRWTRTVLHGHVIRQRPIDVSTVN